jgi:hypothetical protein
MWCLYTEDQEGVDFDDYELSNIKENALPWWILGIFFEKSKQSNKILI